MLHKAKTLAGYKLDSLDGEIGRVEEFYFDDNYWVVRYLVAEAGNWLTGGHVLLSPSKVFIHLTREAIKQSPEFTEESALTRDYEGALHRHYNRQDYWTDEAANRTQFRQQRKA